MICIHHNDLDGRCAAAIFNRYFRVVAPNERMVFIEMDYKDSLDMERIGSGEDVTIVDFSLKPELMAALRAKAGVVTWIDHHATAKEYPYQDLPGMRDFRDRGFSGCELTWIHFHGIRPVPLAVALIGDYDKWALKLPNSRVFYEGMKLLKNGPQEDIWKDLLADFRPDVDAIIAAGRTATTYRDNYCNGLCNSFGYETSIDGHGAYACNQYMFGSGGFGHLFAQYPLCIAYIHDGTRFTVSLYSETIDVGEIAKAHGGGGHKGAAGFVCTELPWGNKP